MEFKKETRPLSQADADVLVVIVFQDEKVEEVLPSLDASFPQDFAAAIAQEAARESFTGKSTQALQLPTYGKLSGGRLVIKGGGKRAEANTMSLRRSVASVARRLSSGTTFDSVALYLPDAGDQEMTLKAVVEGWLLGSYHFKKYKTSADDKKQSPARQLLLLNCQLSDTDCARAAAVGAAIAEATNMARDMVAEPPDYMTPTRLATIALSLVSEQLSCQIIERDEASKMGMGAFLGVARGAHEPPKFIVMRYMHPDAERTIAIAGKGITFDSGGLSIKSALSMEHMKYDMTGAAAVIATMGAIARLKPAINVTAVAAATENMPGSTAMHPGDIVTALNGKTIEVNNTDAEGRLVLADALCFLSNEKPDEIIDVATLTGAVVTALGRAAAGVMGNDDEMLKRLVTIGAQAGEKLWPLPLFDEYKEALKSDVADLKNAGARGEAGSPAAAMFLKEFVNGRPWAHLDIAGPAWMDKEKDELNKGGTAFGVRTLCYYLLATAK